MGEIWLTRFGCVVGQVIESEVKRMFEVAARDGRIKKVEQLLDDLREHHTDTKVSFTVRYMSAEALGESGFSRVAR